MFSFNLFNKKLNKKMNSIAKKFEEHKNHANHASNKEQISKENNYSTNPQGEIQNQNKENKISANDNYKSEKGKY